ncbi:MAG: hypothetical protein ABJC05_03910 [Pyrinomonadaceae bacterium]
MGKYGEDERAQGEVAIKDMQSGEERNVKRESAAAQLRQALGLRSRHV